jgi:hypothetical protein
MRRLKAILIVLAAAGLLYLLMTSVGNCLGCG